ncbi:hypothetical protein Fmac_027135 [Flemingia macrophylla]|uniref:Disease resistance protein RPM1 n=1 Tax=Flemingia macrophylla TaxID=520843 RepID=A0ABD1LGZ9_9FABA
MTNELESFQDFINDADKAAQAEEDDDKHDRIIKWVKRLREAVFCLEDAIDECMILVENSLDDNPDDSRCATFLCEAVDSLKTQIRRLRVAYNLQGAKSLVRAEKEAFQSQFPFEPRSIRPRGEQNAPWLQLRMYPLLIKQDVVGLTDHTLALENLLIEGRQERTVISVVGIPGVGKSTLAKHVFDKVHNKFECHVLITVSRYYTVERLLVNLLDKLCKEKLKDLPQNVSTMDRMSLIQEVQKSLCNKRYVILFDDVWNENFWDDIESSLIDDENKSRILITTRDEKVGKFCAKSSYIKVHKLEEPLSEEECFKLFCKKAFKYGFDGRCPVELKNISLEIVRKCKGLPLAIVAVGGLLSQKDKNAPQWISFTDSNVFTGIERSHIRSIIVFTKERATEQFIEKLFAKYMLLKVLDFEDAYIFPNSSPFGFCCPEALGNFIHLKYLNFGKASMLNVPKSIGKLKNLEILDMPEVSYIPKEISKLRKLRHLLARSIPGSQVKDFLGSLTFLEKIGKLEIDDNGAVIRELEKLKKLRDLSISGVEEKHTDALWSSLDEMRFLEVLRINANFERVIGLPLMSSLSTLRKLYLRGTLKKIPNWISQLQNLVKLSLENYRKSINCYRKCYTVEEKPVCGLKIRKRSLVWIHVLFLELQHTISRLVQILFPKF